MAREVRGVNFGPVWGASGVQNFFGEGYSYHRKWYFRGCPGFNFDGMTFVAKTMTTRPKVGNMPLDDKLMPKEERPKCIFVSSRSWLHGAAANAVGLSNPGAQALFARGEWQKRTKPFFLSFAPQTMSDPATTGPEKLLAEKLEDTLAFYRIFLMQQRELSYLTGLQLNLSCPNTGEDVRGGARAVEEAKELLEILGRLSVPLVVKINVLLAPHLAVQIGRHPACDGICVSNTLPWDSLPGLGIDRRKFFGTESSPLAQYGGGGVSGEPLRALVPAYVRRLRAFGFAKHVNAGGGILRASHVKTLVQAGADSVSLGSIAFLRPWRVQSCIRQAHQELA